MMGLPHRYFEESKQKKLDIGLLRVNEFVENLDLSVELLLNRKVDLGVLYSRFIEGDDVAISKKYTTAAYSPAFAMRNLLTISEKYGFKTTVLRSLQISEAFLQSETNVSVRAISDACELLSKNMSKRDFQTVGELNAFQLENLEVGKLLRTCRSHEEVYEMMTQDDSFVERNWKFNIESSSKEKIVISSKSNPELIDQCRGGNYFNESVDLIRLGFANSMPRFINHSASKSKLIRSSLRGDPMCQIEIDLTPSMRLPREQQYFVQ